MKRAALLAALLLGCAGKPISIGSDSWDVSPGSGGWNGMGGLNGVGGGLGVAGFFDTGSGGSAGFAGAGAAGEPAADCAVQVASGDSHVCVRYANGRVACLGDNTYGQLGEPVGTSSLMLHTIPNAQAQLLAAGGDHNCIATTLGIECWGDNGLHQLGVPYTIVGSLSPYPVLTLGASTIGATLQIVAGSHFACALNSLIHAYCWGGDVYREEPWQIPVVGEVFEQFLVAGAADLRLIERDGLFDVSRNGLVDPPPILVRGASAGVTSNAIGPNHDCILKRSGTVWCRGDGFFDFYTSVTELGTDLVEVKVGDGFTCARSKSGEVRCMGVNDRGQLGRLSLVATPTNRKSSVVSTIPAYAVELSLGRAHGCARMQDASVVCWGAFADHELGTPTMVSRTLGCQPEAKQAWGPSAPVSRPADEYADSALAWAQERCRLDNEGQLLEDCVREETTVLNGCLQSLGASDTQYSTCAGGVLWSAASCAASSSADDTTTFERCQPDIEAACGPSKPRVVDFCARKNLDCNDPSATSLVPNDQVCDDTWNCPNGFDEANCSPDAAVFTCADRTTVPLDAFARGQAACADGSGQD